MQPDGISAGLRYLVRREAPLSPGNRDPPRFLPRVYRRESPRRCIRRRRRSRDMPPWRSCPDAGVDLALISSLFLAWALPSHEKSQGIPQILAEPLGKSLAKQLPVLLCNLHLLPHLSVSKQLYTFQREIDQVQIKFPFDHRHTSHLLHKCRSFQI